MTGLLGVLAAALAGGLLAGRPDPLRARFATGGRGGSSSASVRSRARRKWALPTGGRRRAAAREEEVVAACLALAAELQAGAPVAGALATVAADWPDLFGPVAGAATVGGDIPAALRAAAGRPGAAPLRAVAAGWEVTDRTGAPLARIVTAVADALRADAAIRREVHSQLSTARTTARLLAVLPFGTLLLLSGGDGDAVRFLVGSPFGWACLGAAVLFVSAGLGWVNRLARSATRSAWEG